MVDLNVGDALVQARDEMEAACARISDVQRFIRDNPLPAPALTEGAIVAALKADPRMAAEVLTTLGFTMDRAWREAVAARAMLCCQYASPQTLRDGLQSLAVALAAASYRG